MIRFITAEQTLPIRSKVLRDDVLPPAECLFPGDRDDGSFHLGYYKDEQLVCIATFHRQQLFVRKDVVLMPVPGADAAAYRLRGMATLPGFRGKGIGNQLVNFSIVYLRGRKINYVWCDARKAAWRFYHSLGFEFISDEFQIPDVGPHKVMYLKIQ